MKKIWVDCKKEMNREFAFTIKVQSEGNIKIKISASNAYQIYVNGSFLAFGPLRSAHGSSLITEYTVEKSGELNIAVLVAEYGINSYCFVDEDGFFACEIIKDNTVIAVSDDFNVQSVSERIQKVERLCLQRNFAEDYIMDEDFLSLLMGNSKRRYLKTKTVKGNTLLSSNLSLPDYKTINIENVIESGSVYKKEEGEYYRYSAPESGKISSICKGYDYPELTERFSDEICSFGYNIGDNIGNLLYNAYRLYDVGVNKTGFITFEAEVCSECDLYFAFDEILYDEVKNEEKFGAFYKGREKKVVFHRLYMLNAVKYHLKKGKYKLTTFEPYTFRYIKVIANNGSVKISGLGLILFENPDAYNMNFTCGDERINKVFLAAQNTFAQNSVDVLSDCPSRERAGWLCDSFFSARAEKLLTGENKVEQNFLNNYLIMPEIKTVPKEVFPMCYPADHLNGRYIPNWSMWLVIELYDYFLRTGDRKLVDAFKPKVFRMIDFFIDNFLNEEGLLESLDSWVFIEWSMANDFTQDINYPTNMLFYATLKCAESLYGEGKYKKTAAALKEAIIKYSFNGEFFEDNSKRVDGEIERTGNISETCQYYAFFFKVAERDKFDKLYNNLFETNLWGAKRKERSVYPNVYKSNSFIGNFLRLELIRLKGDYKKVISESLDYLYYQSERTGTLWEYMGATASCNHGFTSYVANILFEAVTGYSGDKNGEPEFNNDGIGIDYSCEFKVGKNIYKLYTESGERIIAKEK